MIRNEPIASAGSRQFPRRKEMRRVVSINAGILILGLLMG